MRLRRLLTASLFLSAASIQAYALTPEDAEALKTKIQSYIGAEKGVIDVVAAGDNFILRLDITPYLAKIKDPNFSAKFEPYVMNIKPMGNGRWEVSQNGPYAFSVKDSTNSFDVKLAESDWTAIYDEALGYFSSSDYTIKGLTFDQSLTDTVTKIKTKQVITMESIGVESKATGNDGVIDLNQVAKFGPISVDSKAEAPPEMAGAKPILDYKANFSGGTQNLSSQGLRVKPILDLIAFFVAHPSGELIKQNQAQLKSLLSAALPLWDRIGGDVTYENGQIGTAMGEAGMGALSIGAEFSGLSDAGLFREAIGFKGLAIPPGLAPPWAGELVPTDFNIDFSIGGVDLRKPVEMFIQEADFTKDKPIADSEAPRYLQAFSPTNSVNITLKDGLIGAAAYAITYDGSLDVTFDGNPKGAFNIRMKGLDDVIAKVQAAAQNDPMAQQAMAGLVGMKGFGKVEADGTTLWAVEIKGINQLTVNGIDLSQMMGGQPAQ